MTPYPECNESHPAPRLSHVLAKRPSSPPRPLWVALLLSLLLALATSAPAAEYNHEPLNELLKAHVQGGGVDYKGLAADQAKLDAYLAPARNFSTAGLSRNEAMAFWINMYNAWTLKLILTKYPNVASIKELGTTFSSPWKKRFVEIGGKTLTLGEIEHEILRKEFKDPRIHFAINCASRSCPPLLPEAYRAATLDTQLDGAARAFINKGANTRIDGDHLFVSRIFKWYRADFGEDIPAYILKYASPPLKPALKKLGSSAKVVYMSYDWSLNTP